MSLTPAWTPLRPHPKQYEAWTTTKRFVALHCGRGSGKTELSRRRIVRMLPVRKPWPDPLYFFALPTTNQARRVAWEPIKALIPPQWITKISESLMEITTVFGSKLIVAGLDKPQRLEGVQYDGGVIDESSDQKPKTFTKTFMPAFQHRKAWCWRIGVPKRSGVGAREFRTFCEKSGDDVLSLSWPSSDIVDDEELAVAREMLDLQDYNEQYNASWANAGGGIFHAFSEVHNVIDRVSYNPKLRIVVGSDFNVDPMCWVIGHANNGGITFFDEIEKRDTNTQATLDELHQRYPNHEGWDFFGDASGRARKTSADSTDYLLIANDKRFKDKRVFYPKGNPSVASRFAASNAILCNANGTRRCFIHPRCKRLIADLNDRCYKEGTREVDDSGDMGHMSDAFGYVIHKIFPVRLDGGTNAPGVSA